MSPEEKLNLEIERVLAGPDRTKLSDWDLNFLFSLTQIFRKTHNNPRSNKGLSPKQKGLARTILEKVKTCQ
ncbi:MAG: hypothetical protein ACRCVV_20065 [Shewanella sp.]